MFKKLCIIACILLTSSFAASRDSGYGLTVKQIYYCGEDFAMLMSNNDWFLVQKSVLGEKKTDHFLSMAMFMMACGKKTANVFPEAPLTTSWCGNSGFRPIKILSVQD